MDVRSIQRFLTRAALAAAFPRGERERLPRSNFRVPEREQSFAGRAHELRRRANIANGEDPRFMAPRAGGRGGAGIGVGWNFKILRDFPHPRRFQLKCGVAIVANVVVAALRLAGIKHVAGTALRADHRDRRERHGVSSMAQTELQLTGYKPISLPRLFVPLITCKLCYRKTRLQGTGYCLFPCLAGFSATCNLSAITYSLFSACQRCWED